MIFMRLRSNAFWLLVLGLVWYAAAASSAAASARQTVALDGAGWRVWLDERAEWKTDTLYLSEAAADLTRLPVHPPTGGWEELNAATGRTCTVPAFAEELFSGGVRTWTYHGVMWFWKTVEIPADWRGRVVRLTCEKARLRVELYVNGRLAGYDLCCETPFTFDLTPYLHCGAPNQIAFRITNPGGCENNPRGYEDGGFVVWGQYKLPGSHDFGGLGGPIALTATAPVYVEDVFVKNLLPAGARNLELQATLRNTTAAVKALTLTAEIRPWPKGRAVFSQSWEVTVPGGATNDVRRPISVPAAKLWDMDAPQLYTCTMTLQGPDVADAYAARFGFRVFEAKEVDGRHNWYFNGQRWRQRSAIDWGYYARVGNRATDEMARRSVENARAIGHNGLNFHRHIGEPLVMKYADELGLYLYEEPGSFHILQAYDLGESPFAERIMEEKCRRMVLRDRNHPSLLIYNMANEDGGWSPCRARVMKMIAALDGTRLISANSSYGGRLSGSMYTGTRQPETPMIRPYGTEFTLELWDDHTVTSTNRFPEKELTYTMPEDHAHFRYWGEVRCHTGPGNWVAIAGLQLPDGRPGYDLDLYQAMAQRLTAFFTQGRLALSGSRVIRTPEDISRQAGRGLMYIDGRVAQAHMFNDANDGFAINGWSGGPQLPYEWDSAICDEGRNLKGPAADYAYWTRVPQVVIQRQNGKYFKPGQTAELETGVIVEGRLPAGDYRLEFTAQDGAGRATAFHQTLPVKLVGGDTYVQRTGRIALPLDPTWKAGYVTVAGSLLNAAGETVAGGKEQVLLQNRPSYARDLAKISVAAVNWPAAEAALREVRPDLPAAADSRKLDVIAAGDQPDDAALTRLLQRVAADGTVLLVRFDKAWAEALHAQGILSQPVIRWGGTQTGHWNGNGWGYLDHYIGDQAVPSGRTIGTTGWEVPDDPVGFWPFVSPHPINVYGMHLARPGEKDVPADGGLLVLLGAIQHGKGRILLAPTYPVDQNNPFSDLLFFEMIKQAARDAW